jgi:cytochrome c5
VKIRTLGKLLALLGLTAIFGLSAQALTDQQMIDMEERIQPVGQVCMEGGEGCASAVVASTGPAAVASSDSRSGKEVYDAACMACHMTGAGGAPKLGDVTAWAARIAKGKDALYQSGINGLPASLMMAKGGCMNCTDEEVTAAVDYIVENSQ